MPTHSHTFLIQLQHPSLAIRSTRLKPLAPPTTPPPPGPQENQERRIRLARPLVHWACSPGRGGPGCARRVGSPHPRRLRERARWAVAVGARSTGTHATRVPVRRAISSHLRSPLPPPLRPPGRPRRGTATIASHRLPALSSRSAAKAAAAAAGCCGAPDPRPRDAPPPLLAGPRPPFGEF
ncbi:serine/arginine repetitive matrix protein 1-like [Suricata suricatta]|uniref:serine/arginine repetitive matrix protein 1-like n=1 Tax=Suricata suricatta TaxID=37032 RepID=UPI001155C4FE|nr:serine/arginine repetitive matrix protein 1-like [Suricata suricatta]